MARLRSIGLNPALQRGVMQALLDDAEQAHDGDETLRPLQPLRVVEVQRTHVVLHDGSDAKDDNKHDNDHDDDKRLDNGTHDNHHEPTRPARVLPHVQRDLHDADDAIAVGDWVLAAPDAYGDLWVHVRVPPTNQIARRLHDGRDKVTRAVIVANVDTALLTMGLDADFNLRRLERYLAMARIAQVEALVVLSKADLCADIESRMAAVRAMLPPLAQVLAVNGLDAQATRGALLPWLQPGRTLVALGSSGAGKSTLSNALLGSAAQDTGPTRSGDGRGRHTTTVRTLHRLPGGACIIDTPGLRTLRLDAEEAAVLGAFDEVGRLAVQCRFRDCRHEAEPGCAVRAGLAPERLKSFHKLGREAARDTMTALDRQRQHAVWRQRSRASRALSKARGKAGA